jgi:RIO kinase 1
MRVPDRLQPLLDHGVIEDVLRPLMSGKEADVFLVLVEGEEKVAKVYKNSQFRSFQHRAEYTEGRRVRSSREARAMKKGSRHGRSQTEAAWQSAEVDAIYALRAAGVHVPEPHAFVEGVLVMELIKDPEGNPAPRLVDIELQPDEARELFQLLLREVVKMLCAGIVHADLSDFNILMGATGPVIIDFPQAVDPTSNRNAGMLLVRDVKNLSSFLGRFAPELRKTSYGDEMWDLFERSELLPDTELTGKFVSRKPKAEVNSLLEDILELEREARERREALGLPPPRRARKPIPREEQAPVKPIGRRSKGGAGKGPDERPRPASSAQPAGEPRAPTDTRPPASPQPGAGAQPDDAPRKRRRRKRRPKSAGSAEASGGSATQSAAPTSAVRPARGRPEQPAGPSVERRPSRGERKPDRAPPGDSPSASPPSARGGNGALPTDHPPSETRPRRRRRRRRSGPKPEGGGE